MSVLTAFKSLLPLRALARAAAPPEGLRRPIVLRAPAEVTTERLSFRPLRPGDEAEFLRVLAVSRAHLRPWFPLNEPGESDRAYFARQLARAVQGDRDRSAWRRAAFLADGTLAGVFHLNRIERGLDFQADACWWINAELTGQGLGTELVAAGVDHALADLPRGLGLHRLHAGIHPDNAASRRIAERLGFVRDPHHASRLLVDGAWQRHDAYVRHAR
jgi:ribosomal-protein-alanine N-acetyltransferase